MRASVDLGSCLDICGPTVSYTQAHEHNGGEIVRGVNMDPTTQSSVLAHTFDSRNKKESLKPDTGISVGSMRRKRRKFRCPITSCTRNVKLPLARKYFDRTDNLCGHLRRVHGLTIPRGERIMTWINENQDLLNGIQMKLQVQNGLYIQVDEDLWHRPVNSEENIIL